MGGRREATRGGTDGRTDATGELLFGSPFVFFCFFCVLFLFFVCVGVLRSSPNAALRNEFVRLFVNGPANQPTPCVTSRGARDRTAMIPSDKILMTGALSRIAEESPNARTLIFMNGSVNHERHCES